MAKTFYISESQYINLVEKKREETKLYKQICEELNIKRTQLTESSQLNEGIIDTIKSYVGKGLMTATLVASLLGANQVSAQQLAQAGVPKATIEQGIEKAKYNPSEMSTKQIDDRLVQIMKKNNLKGSLDSYNQLNPQQKENILNGIKSQVKSLDDVNQVAIGGWEKFDKTNAIKFDTQKSSAERIVATTVDTVAMIPLTNNFQVNSYQLSNPEQLKSELEDLLKGYHTITSITIETSSSTLRNTGEVEGMTWKQLSQKRGEEVSKLLIGQNIDLGGEGKNVVGRITPEMVVINSNGANGDGTSGPKSPYESNPETAKSYQDRGLDASLWQSASKEQALDQSQLSEYDQYQYVRIKVLGTVVEDTSETVDTYTYRYIYLQVKKDGGSIEKGTKFKKADIAKCSVKVPVVKMQKLR